MNDSSSSRLWGPESDILSMETRILPGRTPPISTRPEVQIPARKPDHSSMTPPDSSARIIPPQKRPQSECTQDPELNPTPSKRQRVCLRLDNDEIMPKIEADQTSIIASPGNGNSVDPPSEATIEPAKTQAIKHSYAHNLGTEMIEFRFGAQKLPSSIHKKVLCDKIPGFNEELKRLEPWQNEVMFPEDMKDTIALLVEWCYVSSLDQITPSTSPEECYERIKLYCLAAKYEQVELMNQTMDFITTYLRKNLPRWDIQWCTYSYNNTARGSPLRTLMAKWWAQKFLSTDDKGRWSTDMFSSAARRHSDLLYDVLVHLRSQSTIKVGNPKKDPPATYHLNVLDPEPSEPRSEKRTATPEDSDSEISASEESSESESESDEDDEDDEDEDEEDEEEEDVPVTVRRSGRS